MMNEIAVVLLNWNGKHWLEKFLPTVVKYSPEAKIYVIDNSSTDESVAFIAKNFPAVTVIKNEENYGFAEGYNRGLQKIKEPLLCLLNSDVEVTEGWLQPMQNLFVRRPEVAAAQPKILNYNHRNFFEFAGAAGGLLDNLGFPYCRGRIFGDLEEDLGQYDGEAEIFWAGGCCFFVRAADFHAVGGFDERFFAHQEEIDLCWRLKNQGRKIFFTSESTVYHVGGGTLGVENPRKTFLNIRNNLLMLLKNLPLRDLLWVLPFRLFLDAFTGIYFLVKYGLPHFLAVIRAHWSFFGMIPETLRRRGKFQIKDYYSAKFLVFKNFLN